MREKVLFIINPRSGKGQIKNRLLEILDLFTKNGLDVTVYTTQCCQDASRVVRERADEFDRIFCSGGDGTLDEVITGMMQGKVSKPLGYIPGGSTNDFAHSLKIPGDIITAAKVITLDRQYLCDIGAFNDDYFVYIAAFGLFTDVSYQTSQELKNILGHVAYVLEGAKRLFNIKSYKMTVQKGDESFSGDFIYGMITNSESVGGFRNMTGKNVKLNDGLFEVTLIKMPKNPIELQEIIGALLLQEVNPKYMYSFKADKLTVEAEEEVPWTLDGEFGGSHKHLEIVNHKQAIPILVKSIDALK